MTARQRLTFLGIAAVIAVVAVILLAGGGDETDRAANPAQTATPTASASDGEATATPTPTPTRSRRRCCRRASVKALTFKQGETVRFRVRNDKAEEVHVHGYDIKKELEPNKTATMSFKATINGIFEIELEGSGTQLASLKVVP